MVNLKSITRSVPSSAYTLTEFQSAHAGIIRGVAGPTRCRNLAADSKTEKNLGHNLSVTRLVSQRYIVN